MNDIIYPQNKSHSQELEHIYLQSPIHNNTQEPAQVYSPEPPHPSPDQTYFLIADNNNYQALKDIFLNALDTGEFTKKLYSKNLDKYFNYIKTITNKPTREDILGYKQMLSISKKPATVNTYLTPVRLFYNFLSSTGLSPNITVGVKQVPDSKNHKKDALSIFQAKLLLQQLESREDSTALRDYALCNLMLRTGLRDIEVNRANVGDLGSKSGKNVLYIWGKGKVSKDDFVILTDNTLEAITNYLRTRKSITSNQPLFASTSNRNINGRLSTRSISGIVKRALVETGLHSERLTAHSLRHTAVTFSLLGGATIQEAQAMARHSNIQTTMRYAHNINRMEHAAESKIDDLLNG